MSEITPNTLTGSVEPEMQTPPSSPAPDEGKADAKPEGEVKSEQGAAKPEVDDAKEKEPRAKTRAQTRIEELARDRKNLRRQLARANQTIGELRAEKAPREEDFSNPADYQAAVSTRAARTATLESQRAHIGDELQSVEENRRAAFSDIVAESGDRFPGFRQAFESTPVSDAMAEEIMESDDPLQLAFWLSQNKQEARRIYDLPPVEAARALGRIDARLSVPKPKTKSSAPRPPETVSGKAHSAGKSPNDMTTDEYRAWRMAQIKAKQGH